VNNKTYYIYILTNKRHTVYYTGVTSDLIRRTYDHKQKFVHGFAEKYNADQLVYYEATESIESAIAREKQIKDFRRSKKVGLIISMNPEYEDLFPSLL